MNSACSQAGDQTEASDTADEAAQQLPVKRSIASLRKHTGLYTPRTPLRSDDERSKSDCVECWKHEHVDRGGSEERSGARLAAEPSIRRGFRDGM